MSMRICMLLILATALAKGLAAQQRSLPLERFVYTEVQRNLHRDSSSTLHMGMKPGLLRRTDLSNTFGFKQDSSKYWYRGTAMIWRDHMVKIEEGDFRCTIDLLFDMNYGMEFREKSPYSDSTNHFVNSRGLLVQADLGKDVSFQSAFVETQAVLPAYQRAWLDANGVMPGMGRVKPYRTYGFDYGMSFGNVTYSPNDHVILQMGYGRHFVGFGYRSLLLSDAAFVHPYTKAQVNWWDGRLEYTTIMSVLQNQERMPLGEVPEALFRRKIGAFHYLSFKPTRWLELGVFEGTMWQRWTPSAGVVALPVMAYSPILGTSLASNGFDGSNNVVLGLNGRVVLLKRAEVYGQWLADDPSSGRTGYQAGLHVMNAGLRNLDVRVEWNVTSDYLYAHRDVLLSYSNHNQPLGHPTGAGMEELVLMLGYRYNRWIAEVKANQVKQVQDARGQWTTNPDVMGEMPNLPRRELMQIEATVSYFMQPKTNSRIVLGYIYRDESWGNDINQQTGFLFFGLRSNIMNRYFDF